MSDYSKTLQTAIDSDSEHVSAFATAFAEVADKDETVSAIELTDLINEHGERSVSDKTVRAHLRKLKRRDQSKFKNALWRITATVALDEFKYFERVS